MVTQLERNSFRDRLLQSCDAYLGQSPSHRLAIGIISGGNFYVFGNGIGVNDQYDIGSVSKTFTAHLVLLLAQKGALDLSKSVDHYLTLKPGRYPTVAELLTHTAGYSHITPWEVTVPSLLTKPYLRKNIYEQCKKEDILRYLQRRNRHKARNTYGYSDFSYGVLAVVCEAATGIPFKALLEDFIKNTLQMGHTEVTLKPESRTVLPAHKGKTLPYWVWQDDNPYLASGGMASSIYDMLQYVALQLHAKEAFITDAHVLEAQISKSNVLACKGWHTYKKSNQLWHVGGVGTFRSSIVFNRKRGLGVVVLGNGKGIRSANVHYLAKVIYGELKSKKIKLP